MNKLLFGLLCTVSFSAFASVGDVYSDNNEKYCDQTGGKVISLQNHFDYGYGANSYDGGLVRNYCLYNDTTGNRAVVGLDTLSKNSSLAASFVKTLKIDKTKPLPDKPFHNNPALNVCVNLGGSSMSIQPGYNAGGGVSPYNEEDLKFLNGEADFCTFADGSSISAWTLIYVASGQRLDIKKFIRSKPLANLVTPDIYK